MQALWFDKNLSLKNIPQPIPQTGQALVRVLLAGICNTDHEIIKGYVPGFNGVLGHELVGCVEAGPPHLLGKRVAVEINFGCGTCPHCLSGDSRHCPKRGVLGIISQQGAFAEYLCAPEKNCIPLPSTLSNEQAVFLEPLAAAVQILKQVPISSSNKVALFGDGKLAQLIARVIQSTGANLIVVGKHLNKLDLIPKDEKLETFAWPNYPKRKFDVVIEATGSPQAFEAALNLIEPKGYLVLKSTYSQKITTHLTPIVLNEIHVVGSRCGKFEDALNFLMSHPQDFSPLISKKLPFSSALEAFEQSSQKDKMKVLLELDKKDGQKT